MAVEDAEDLAGFFDDFGEPATYSRAASGEILPLIIIFGYPPPVGNLGTVRQDQPKPEAQILVSALPSPAEGDGLTRDNTGEAFTVRREPSRDRSGGIWKLELVPQ